MRKDLAGLTFLAGALALGGCSSTITPATPIADGAPDAIDGGPLPVGDAGWESRDVSPADAAVAEPDAVAGVDAADGGGTPGTDGGAPAADGGLDPTEVEVVSGWLTNRSSGFDNWVYDFILEHFSTADQLDRLVGSIVGACAAFAPSLADWQRYCEALIASAIVSESSYQPDVVVNDSPGDPTVGLLQDRFSSTVRDYNYYGPIGTMAAIGCAWPPELLSAPSDASLWTSEGGTTYLGFLQDVACNVGLGTWYYFMNATGNGGSSAVYVAEYCQGGGVGATLVVGLMSHNRGPAGAHPPDPSDAYVTGIKARFVSLLGGLPSPDPFTVVLQPDPSKYCQ